MSKSLKTIILGLAALFVAIIIGGIAFVRGDAENNRIAELEHNLRESERATAAASQGVAEAQAAADAAKAAAAAQAAKAAEMAAKVEEIQQAAAERAAAGNLREPAPQIDGKYGLGRQALPVEIAAWDVDILPDGRGLPVGSGDAIYGEEVFAEKCASCHGDFAEGVDNWPVLAGGLDTLADEDPVKTIGSYWPHLSTVWDYIHRSMPFGEAQTLSDDEVYAMTAYILYSNDLVDEDFVLSNENFAEFKMHNKDGFVLDTRPEEEYAIWTKEPCMSDCKDKVEITMRASVLDVTPEEEGAEESLKEAKAEVITAPVVAATVTETVTATVAAKVTEVVAPAALDQSLVDAGEKVFKKCKACHQVGAKAKNRSGPHLNNIMGRTMGSVDGFKYSKAFKQANADGRVWDAEAIAAFMKKPKAYMKGTKMSFSGLKKDKDIEAITEFLKAQVQ